MRFSMSDQTQIINYFKFVDQSNSTSIKSIKFNTFINCFNSTSRVYFSVNHVSEISQYQHIAIDETSSSKIQQKQKQKFKTRASVDSSKQKYLVDAVIDHINQDIRVETSLTNARRYESIKSSINSTKKLKFSIFSNRFNSTLRIDFSINQVAETSQHEHIAIDETSSLKTQQKIKNCFSSRSFEQEYIVVTNVDHTTKDIRVETSLTNARKYESVKSLIKSDKLIKKLKFRIFNNKFSSTSRVCFSVNQIAETSHIALDEILNSTSYRSFKSLKFAIIITSLNSALRFSLSVNHDSIMSQMLISMFSRIDFLRVLINKVTYVSILAFFRTMIHHCRRRFYTHLDIRVETTLKKTEK